MNIIISHDVDHLYRSDHLRDLSYPKLWARESLGMLRGKLGPGEWARRMLLPFKREQHHIREVCAFDKAHGVPSSFFFGMERGLGMSYTCEKAGPLIRYVEEQGFFAGVHGIDFQDEEGMRRERGRFCTVAGHAPLGIRMHYVRYDEKTFSRLDRCGYRFDSTEFDKAEGSCLNAPYRVGGLWEFPVCVMDSYLPARLEDAKARTLQLLEQAEAADIGYFTLLFHDYYASDAWACLRDWYHWVIPYLKNDSRYHFVSFMEAVEELEKNRE